jgi:voltage-gated sodium channel
MLIVLYLYSIIGFIMFRGQSEVITGIGAVKDPFVSVPESMFSMFRVITGEDLTDLRYDLLDNLTDFMMSLFPFSLFPFSLFRSL